MESRMDLLGCLGYGAEEISSQGLQANSLKHHGSLGTSLRITRTRPVTINEKLTPKIEKRLSRFNLQRF